MTLSEQGLKFIKEWEKFRAHAYKDQAGIWTIGYGTIRYPNGQRVMEGDFIIEPNALIQIIQECSGIVNKLNQWIQVSTKQHEFDALVSLSYNIGTQGFRTSTLLAELNTKRPIIENYFTRWNKITIDGRLIPSAGLTRRRQTEWMLFKFADYTGNTVPIRA